MRSVVFVSPTDARQPTEIHLPDGGVIVRQEIFVPDEADTWTEYSCNDAFETLARLPSIEYFPYYSISIHFIDLTALEFFGWIRTRGFTTIPTFWRMSETLNRGDAAPRLGGDHKEERKGTARGPLRSDVEAAYEERVKTYLGKKPPSRIDDEKWAKEQFGLGVTKARDLRRNLAPPDWREPGRRKCKD
jgi:hypothetical protein